MANYIKNKDLLIEIELAKAERAKRPDDPPGSWLSPTMGGYILLMVDQISHKHNWRHYTYLEDMKSMAHINFVKAVTIFNTEKSKNPFAYFTTTIERSFLGVLGKEKTQGRVKESMLMEDGLLPSWNTQCDMDKELAKSIDSKTK